MSAAIGTGAVAIGKSRGNKPKVGAGKREGGLPSAGGTYALLLRLEERLTLRVGKLGECTFTGGYYVYVGSAFGAGGLRARVARHLRGDRRVHWHIDTLLAHAQVFAVFYAANVRLEHCWSQALNRMRGAEIPLRGFGASDCREGCAAHLIRYARGIDPKRLRKILTAVA